MHVSLLRPRFVTLALASAALALSLSPSRLRAAEKPATAPVKADGFSFVKTVGAISEYQLTANGLAVLLLPEHSAPVVTFMVTYRVGSRNEVTGTTGASSTVAGRRLSTLPRIVPLARLPKVMWIAPDFSSIELM